MGQYRGIIYRPAVRRICFAFLMAVFFTANLFGGSAFATTTSGIITDVNGIRWEYVLATGEQGARGSDWLEIRFYDKPENSSTVTVPSLSELKSLVANAPANLDTYFLVDADTAAQDATYTSITRRQAAVDTTVLDMQNTSKIQILGVKPIIDPQVETELIFGSNMVLGDGDVTITAYISRCASFDSYGGPEKYCNQEVYGKKDPVRKYEQYINGWDSMTKEQKEAYEPTSEAMGCTTTGWSTTINIEEGGCYLYSFEYEAKTVSQAFSGYKLKLTNFDSSNFNYVGWEAFSDSIFNEANTTMTIDGTTFMGSDIFRNTNIKKAILNTNTMGAGLFRDCAQLTEVEFGNNTSSIVSGTFAGTGLTSISFEGSTIKAIGASAFEGASIRNVNFDGIERIEYQAFKDNDIGELYLPKSINWLSANIFKGNANLKKITIAYDTLTSGTTLPMFVVLGYQEDRSESVEELNIIAPYAENENVSDTHVSYEDYKWHYDGYQNYSAEPVDRTANCYGWVNYSAYTDSGYPFYDGGPASSCGTSYYTAGYYNQEPRNEAVWTPETSSGNGSQFETDYAEVENKKNILAPIYFMEMDGLKKITIGEGYEFIGSSAFISTNYAAWGMDYIDDWWSSNRIRNVSEINLPSTLKGIGNLAFESISDVHLDMELPESLEFIGQAAFRHVWSYDGDVDLPNLKALGDEAFKSTLVEDIYLHDKMVYLGREVFTYCLKINDVTFDFDVFNPNLHATWAGLGRSASADDLHFRFTELFGVNDQTAAYGYDEERVTRIPLVDTTVQRFGTITFTEKAVSELPNCYGLRHSQGNNSFLDAYNNFFGYMAADKIDIGKTGWKVLTPEMFVVSVIDEVVLPENLEVIMGEAFSNALIEEELVIPDTVKVIGDQAFNCAGLLQVGAKTPTITSLPSTIEYIGREAFYGDTNLTADLLSENLKVVQVRAFQGTHLRDVLIPSGVTFLHEATFGNIPTLRNVTIDSDLGSYINTAPDQVEPDFSEYVFPESLVDFAGNDLEASLESHMFNSLNWISGNYSSGSVYGGTIFTFYSIFNHSFGSLATAGEKYGNLVIKSHSTTVPGKVSFFSHTDFDVVDLSESKWYNIGTNSLFAESTIGSLYLPNEVVTLNNSLFYKAKIGNTVVLPTTMQQINGNVFQEAELGGLDIAEGLQSINGSSFYKAVVKDEVNLPLSFRTINGNSFQESKLGGLSIAKGLETIGQNGFYMAEIGGEFSLPSSLKSIGWAGFMHAKMHITNSLPEGIETLGGAAFYDTAFSDNLVIPASLQSIGHSALSTGDTTVHYDTITINADLPASKTGSETVFQMLWNIDVDKMIVNSSKLTAYDRADAMYNEEFWHMPFDEIKITKLPKITYWAFKDCPNLTKVDLSEDTALRSIGTEAFRNATLLDEIHFSSALKNEDVVIKTNAFMGTAFKSIGDSESDFDLTAAKFDGSEGYAFANMPKVESVKVPATFSGATIPMASFANDTELVSAEIDYRTTQMDTAAFANDSKLARIFIWGNTKIYDSNLTGYDADAYGRGGDDDEPEFGPTIPEGTDIYAYSTSPARYYAEHESRAGFEGVFYPLDEVLYLTSNKKKVKINDANDDFEKDGVTLYAMRRDGIVLESDTWGEFDGVAFPRSEKDLHFDKMLPTIAADPDFGTIWDTPVPLDELDLSNENFENIDYELIMDEATEGVKLVNVKYTDKLTSYLSDTDLEPFIPGEIIDGPVTFAENIFIFFTLFAGCWCVVFIAKGIRRRRA